jgi:futalosine hydrolase
MSQQATMSFKILYVTATQSEADALKRIPGIESDNGVLRLGRLEISLLVAGIGSFSTFFNMYKWLSVNKKPDLVINAGIAGSYNDKISIGDVVMPVTDCFADTGIENGDSFLTLFEAGLLKPDEFPFIGGQIPSDDTFTGKLKHLITPVRAITVNTSTGSELTRVKMINKFNPDIETMEGATFFYICVREKIPFLTVRSISNRVELRNRDNWNVPLALDKLSEKLNEVFKHLSKR